MKLKIISVFIFILLIFAIKVYSQEADITAIMGQNKIRTCLNAEIKGDVGAPGHEPFDSSVRLTGTCSAPDGCEIWQYHVDGKKWTKVVEHVPAGAVDQTINETFIAHTTYQWYAIGDAASATGQGGSNEENQTQQIGQVDKFEFPQEGDQKCTSIHWDPFGRVFDAVSLEPIEGVQVSLFQNKSKQLVALPNNPTITDNRGVYNIFVDQEDDYYLNAVPLTTHSFTKSVVLDLNYNKVYSNIYKPGDIFHEAPLPAVVPDDFDFSPYHHDIPLVPKGEPYHGAVAKIIDGSLIQVDLGDWVNYSGKVTYPLARICLVAETAGVVKCDSADKYGSFSLSVGKDLIPQEFIEVKVEKVDLTNLP